MVYVSGICVAEGCVGVMGPGTGCGVGDFRDRKQEAPGFRKKSVGKRGEI